MAHPLPTRRRTSLMDDFANRGRIDRKPPTIHDLRVKQCYICRDEEVYDDPPEQRREWVHPCKCRLIAHQECLMELLTRRPVKRPKCPQCGYEYQTEKNIPLLASSLIFRVGDTIFQAMGMSFITTSAIGLGVFTITSVAAVGLGYGAIAVREYFGAPLFDLLMTDEPTSWRIHHWIFLCLTPLRLVYSPLVSIGAFTPFFFLWSPSPPLSVRTQLLSQSNRIGDVSYPISSNPAAKLISSSGIKAFGLLTLGTSWLYNRYFPKFSEWVLGMKLPPMRSFFGGLTVRREFRRQQGPDGEEQGAVLHVEREMPEEPDTPINNLSGVTRYSNISVMVGLLKPFVASGMGHLLYFGAQHSRRLRFVLGIPHPDVAPPLPRLVPELYENEGYWRYYTETAIHQMDPVWIRNTVGLGKGLFTFVSSMVDEAGIG
ncbi:hypothetical protein D9757_012313 [Collybiopsis confluens]|uniref:RING-CH-type domain-containing protein n=1 Tax=Collybiopsis confluens TaxID=2823264 RepID=A0A8H5LKY6_9AGAR|nr:hypothetical protein D9757_012313 [Collybiopsis confluens]